MRGERTHLSLYGKRFRLGVYCLINALNLFSGRYAVCGH